MYFTTCRLAEILSALVRMIKKRITVSEDHGKEELYFMQFTILSNKRGDARHNDIWDNDTECNVAEHNDTECNVTEHNVTEHNLTEHNLTEQNDLT